MGEDLDFVCYDIQGIESGENRKVILRDTAYFIVRVLDHVESDCEGGCKKKQECDHPSHNLCPQGVAHKRKLTEKAGRVTPCG